MNSRVLPLLALIISVGMFFAYVSPTWSGPIAATKLSIENDKKALAAADEYKKSQDALTAARDAIDPNNLTRLETFLPDSVDNVGLILDINALAARSGLALANVDVAKNDSLATLSSGSTLSAANNPVGSVDLSLSALGTYSALNSFLLGLEKSARLLDVRDITVKGSDTGVYNYQMVIRLYWLR